MIEKDMILGRDTQVGVDMAWHGKTTVVPEIKKDNCKIIYPMIKKPMFILGDDGQPLTRKRILLDEEGNETQDSVVESVSDHFSIVSLDDGLPIGNPVKKNYKLIPNEMIFDIVENALAGTSHKIVSIGSLCNREKLFCSIKISEDFIAGNRQTENVLSVLWGHGGVFGITGRSSFTVAVCRNTFNRILGQKKNDFRFTLRHSGDAELKLTNMGKAIDAHYGVTAEFTKAMNDLADTSCSESRAKEIFTGFLVREDVAKVEEVSTRTRNTIDRLSVLFKTGKGNQGKDLSDVFNAFTDYYSHESSGGENRWKQFESSEMGSGNTKKGEAYDLLTGRKTDFGTLLEVEQRGNKVLQLV